MQLVDILYRIARYNIPRTTAIRHIKQGWCPWPPRPIDGVTSDIAYGCWENMIQRCSNPNAAKYENYGGRGITVCPEWRDFRIFIKDMGPRPSRDYSIDRIDPDGNYEPGNCRWATYTEQACNKRGIQRYHKLDDTVSCLRVIDKHGKKFRIQYKGKRYTFSTYEEADKFRHSIQEAS